KVNMLQYSTYSVISPEGCASILWKSADKAPLAAEAMGIIAPRLKELKLIDSIIPEPLDLFAKMQRPLHRTVNQPFARITT
ncbi:hypothetical protein QU811_38110, partial [Escherichia coli]|nr:hypothetical protein [Escherichia coli]